MSADVITCVSGMVSGYLSIVSTYVTNAGQCLRFAAGIIVLLSDGVTVSLGADIGPDDVVERVRWHVTVTPEIREACRVLLIEEQRVVLDEAYGAKARAA